MQARRDKAQKFWESAVEVSRRNDYNYALQLLSEAIGEYKCRACTCGCSHRDCTDLDPAEPCYVLSRAHAHMKLSDYAAALRDFSFASTMTTYEPSVITHLRIARCRLLLGSSQSALLAVRNALSLDARNNDALQLRQRILKLEGHMDAYRRAVSRYHWRLARSAYESCLSVYAQEGGDAPGHIQCWGVELLIAESAWEEATKSIK